MLNILVYYKIEECSKFHTVGHGGYGSYCYIVVLNSSIINSFIKHLCYTLHTYLYIQYKHTYIRNDVWSINLKVLCVYVFPFPILYIYIYMACRCLLVTHFETSRKRALSTFTKSFVCKYCTVFILEQSIYTRGMRRWRNLENTYIHTSAAINTQYDILLFTNYETQIKLLE